MGRSLITAVILLLTGLQATAQDHVRDDLLKEIIGLYGQAEVTVPIKETDKPDELSKHVSVIAVWDNKFHIMLSVITVDWFILQDLDYVIIERDEGKGIVSASTMTKAMDWDSYPTYTQYDSIMRSYVADYPALCRLDTIGTSIYGKLVMVLKISDNVDNDEDEPEVFYSSTMHGDETGGFVLMLRLAGYLLQNYEQDTRVRDLVDNLEIWINPLANPDGTYRTGDVITSPTRFNANGYDLNRNFPDTNLTDVNRQKETLDMITFMRKHMFVISANFHSGEEVVNYPWDRWYSLHADDAWFYDISRRYADTVHLYSGPGYMNFLDDGVTRGIVWYRIYGGRQDFVTWELQGREVTIELDDQYITPAASLPQLWDYNRHSLLEYIRNALYGIHGTVLDITSDQPVPAKIFIEGHDKDSSHIYSDTLSGKFIRLIEPGIWDITFTAQGYLPATFEDIEVLPFEKRELNVFMVPVINTVDTTHPHDPVLYPNPATSVIKAVLPDRLLGTVKVRVINQSGILMSEYITETIYGIPLEIETRSFPAGTYTVIFSDNSSKISSHGRFIVIK